LRDPGPGVDLRAASCGSRTQSGSRSSI